METKKKLSLNKETIISLNSETMYNIQGGQADIGAECNATKGCGRWTGGCTDGCWTLGTIYHCTDGHCTQDCSNGLTETGEKEKTSGNGAQ